MQLARHPSQLGFLCIIVLLGHGGKRNNYRVKVGKDCIDYCFLSAKNNIVLINLFILRGLGACSPSKFFNCQDVSGGF